MEILIIGTGADIPPDGWGAVESIIWEHMTRIPKFGVNVDLVNTLNWMDIASMALEKNKKYDFVHCHYDIQWPYLKALSYRFLSGMSSHFPYIGNEDMYASYGYWKVMRYFLDDQHDNLNFCISDKDVNYFKSKGVNENKIFRLKLGASEDIRFSDAPMLPGKSIYLGKVSRRKRQKIYGDIECIDFAGNLEDENSAIGIKNYVGEWPKEKVYNDLTDYGNLILLSDGENTPLVIREALIAGIGIVCSESSIEELDEKPYITVIPDEKLDDLDYVREKIELNREISLGMKAEIRDYGISKFGWDACVKHYLSEVERAVESRKVNVVSS